MKTDVMTDQSAKQVQGSAAALPPENPLAMPIQSLRKWPASARRAFINSSSRQNPQLMRLFVFGGALLLTLYGVTEMYAVVSVGTTTVLQYILVALFTVNFSWIALAFTSAIAGFVYLLLYGRRKRPADTTPLKECTAILMPVYNEETARVFAAVQAIRESVDATGQGLAFDYFILSDSDTPGCMDCRRTGNAGLARTAW